MCSNPKSPILGYGNGEQKTFFYFRADCKLWTCVECANKERTRVAARAGRGADEFIGDGLPIDHITITANRYWRGQERSIKNFRANWPKLRKRVQYWCGNFNYAVFAEHHKKDDSMHVHMLATNIFTTRWWKDNAAQCGLGFQSKVREVEHGGMAALYATKYISKSLEVEKWPARFHRCRFSANWPKYKSDFETQVEWRVFVSLAAFNDEMRHWQRQGYRIINTREENEDGEESLHLNMD